MDDRRDKELQIVREIKSGKRIGCGRCMSEVRDGKRVKARQKNREASGDKRSWNESEKGEA